MIDSLIAGRLIAKPEPRKTKTGATYALAKLRTVDADGNVNRPGS